MHKQPHRSNMKLNTLENEERATRERYYLCHELSYLPSEARRKCLGATNPSKDQLLVSENK